MKQQVKRLFDWVEGLVDPFAPQDGVADKRPLRFLFQAMRPFRTVMILASVLGIVRTLGGGIRLTSRPGKGSTFRVLLPVAEPDSAAEAAE